MINNRYDNIKLNKGKKYIKVKKDREINRWIDKINR